MPQVVIEKEAIKAEIEAFVASPKFDAVIAPKLHFAVKKEVASNTNVGDMSVEKGVNIGSIVMDGGSVIVGVGLAGGALLLWRKYRKAIKTVDLLVKNNEDRQIDGTQKLQIRTAALAHGVEKTLRWRVDKVRKKAKK